MYVKKLRWVFVDYETGEVIRFINPTTRFKALKYMNRSLSYGKFELLESTSQIKWEKSNGEIY